MPTPGIPESLNVLLQELRGLGLCIKIEKKKNITLYIINKEVWLLEKKLR